MEERKGPPLRNAGVLKKLEKAKKGMAPSSFQKKLSPDDRLILVQ